MNNKRESEILLPILTNLGTDQRCFKIASSLASWGYRPVVLCDRPRTPPGPAWEGIEIRVLTGRSHLDGFSKVFVQFAWRLLRVLCRSRSRLWMAEDGPPLLVTALVGKLRGVPVVYDAHELFTESPELARPGPKRLFWKFWIWAGMRACGSVMCTSEAMARVLRPALGQKAVFVLPNVPRRSGAPLPPKSLSDTEPVRLLYQGYLRTENSLESLAPVMAEDARLCLRVVGDGPDAGRLRDAMARAGVLDRLERIATVPFEQLGNYSTGAHIGLHLVRAVSGNVKYTLPNKVFDYAAAGLPVLCGTTPAVEELLGEFRVGVVVDAGNPQDVRRGLDEILDDYAGFVERCRLASARWNWEAYEPGLRRFLGL